MQRKLDLITYAVGGAGLLAVFYHGIKGPHRPMLSWDMSAHPFITAILLAILAASVIVLLWHRGPDQGDT